MRLPELVHDFDHARIVDVVIGPRREVALVIAPLVWDGHNGRSGQPVSVRFGGIVNYEEVCRFFSGAPHEKSELAWLRYADEPRSKPGQLFFELVFERSAARLTAQCSGMQVTG
jgi:hypothetical protein